MEKRQYDIFMDLAHNPTATLDNLVVAGFTADNTSLQDKEKYRNDPWVQENFKNQFGEFDEAKFNAFYSTTKILYNDLANQDYNKSMLNLMTYHRDNMEAPREKRRKGPDFIEYAAPNPYKSTNSVINLGIEGPRTKSIDEIAQSRRVLLNPTSAGDNLENAQWGDAPEDSFWGYFLDTLVLAQYDDKGTHTDPLTGQEVQHEKGDLKLDDTGNFYYEKLDGRDVYGRRVLNKLNVLTKEGSWANQLDFFDSDDIEQKGVGASLLKNLALVGTMFLPVVGPWIAGLSVATQLVGVMGTLGKMAVGSDSPTLSAMEGWAKSMNRQTAISEYAQEHPWCLENLINLVGDSVGQIREQRMIFEWAPAIFKGKTIPVGKEARLARLKQIEEAQAKIRNTQIQQLAKQGSLQELTDTLKVNTVYAAQEAELALAAFEKSYNQLGSVIGRGYMTGIVVADTYGEAKQAGATDLEATILTLGYAAAEYGLLSTELNMWIMPEVKQSGIRYRAIQKALAGLNKENQTSLSQFGKAVKDFNKDQKRNYFKKLFGVGKDIANETYSVGSKTFKASIAAGLGEGLEEVSEELLADFSKGCYDVVKWLRGEDTRINSFGFQWNDGERSWNGQELIDRYGLSFVGGFIGGGINNVGTNYRMVNNYNKMGTEQALQELMWISKEGQTEAFLKSLDKVTLLPTNLSFDYDEKTGTFAAADKHNSQDAILKRMIIDQVRMIDNFVHANNILTNNKFLTTQVQDDLRFNYLFNSTTAGAFIQEYVQLTSDIYKLTQDIKQYVNPDTNNDGHVDDKEGRRAKNKEAELNEDDKKKLDSLRKELKEKREKLQEFADGKRSYDFISAALFEMSPFLSKDFVDTIFPLYAEQKSGKKYNELTDQDKSRLYEEYEKFKTTALRDKILTSSQIFLGLMQKLSPVLKQQADNYLNTSKELVQANLAFANIFNQIFANGDVSDQELVQVAQEFQNGSQTEIAEKLLNIFGDDITKADLLQVNEKISKVNSDKNLTPDEKKQQLDQLFLDKAGIVFNSLADNITQYIQPFIDRGFITTETKNKITKFLNWFNKDIILPSQQQEQERLNAMGTLGAENIYQKIFNQVIALNSQIKKLSTTPIEQNIDEISLNMGGEAINLSQLIEKLNRLYSDTSQQLNKFNIGDDLAKDLDNAIYALQLYKALIRAARTDSGDVDNIYGYNAVLNEASKNIEGDKHPQLTTIDHSIADIIDADIESNLATLLYYKTLHDINNGQKLTRQDRVGVKKDLLIWKRLINFVSVLPEDKFKDWEGFMEFKTTIEGLKTFDQVDKSGNLVLDEETAVEFEKDKMTLENAVYDFFHKNEANLNNIDKLTEFINPERFQLYDEPFKMLTENLESLDDNSILWWIASRVAVRSQDFYNQFKQIIQTEGENPIAPIPTQELAVYLNYASVVNSNIFKNFYRAYRKSIKENWKKLDSEPDKKREILKRLGIKDSDIEEMIKPERSDQIFNFIPVPRYSSVVLTEGAPGTGKSTGVFQTTLKLLRTFNPEVLTKVAVVHGANGKSAIKLRDSVGLDDSNSKTFGRGTFMKEVNSSWKNPEKKKVLDKDGNEKWVYDIPSSNYQFTDEKELRSNATVKQTSPFSLIIIDEISKFSSYDLDEINQYAENAGITVLVAGDFDQSGVIGKHKIDSSLNMGSEWETALSRVNFIRTPKLGVSMRAGNSLKVENLNKLWILKNGLTKTKEIDFRYFEDSTGLYGDKFINYEDGDINSTPVDMILEEIQKLIDTLEKDENGKPISKIGYIYNNEDSEVYQALQNNPAYKQYISFREGGSAQGLEAQYYIIEPDINSTTKEFLNDLYTGISRAEQGSIVLMPYEQDHINIENTPNKEKINQKLDNSDILKYAKRRKDLLDKVVTTGNPIKVQKGTQEVQTQTNTQGSTNQDSSNQGSSLPAVANSNTSKPTLRPATILDDTVLNPGSNMTAEESIINVINNITSEQELNNYIEQIKVWGFDPNNVNIANAIRLKQDQLTNNPDGTTLIATNGEGTLEVVETDVITEKEYTELVNNTNETAKPKPIMTALNKIASLLHSFNTFELGVRFDSNKKIIKDDWTDQRIDSICGLLKIDALNGVPERTGPEYIKILGDLRSAIFNTTDKAELEKKIEKILNLSGIYSTFAMKWTKRNDGSKEYAHNSPSIYDKGISEEILFNYSNDTRSNEWISKEMVLIIGTNETNNLLEIPLLSLSSPFTVAQMTDENGALKFPEVWNDIQTMLNNGIDLYHISVEIAKKYDGTQYQELANMFDFWSRDAGEIFFEDDPQWTIAKDLELLGPQIINDGGDFHSILPGFSQINEKDQWVSLYDFSTGNYGNNPFTLTENPNCNITKVMISTTGRVDGIARTIVNAGHPFVLVSFNKELKTDKQIYDQFIKQQKDPDVRKEVILMYVIPPEYSIEEFIQNKRDIISGVEGATGKHIGTIASSYKLLKILMKDDTFKARLEEKMRGAVDLVQNIINELDALVDENNMKPHYNKLLDACNLSSIGFEEQSITRALDRILADFAYDRATVGVGRKQSTYNLNPSDLKIITDVLNAAGITGVYFHVTSANSVQPRGMSFLYPSQGQNYTDPNGHNKPFRINGKVDSYTFRGTMGSFIASCLAKINTSGRSTDGLRYFYKGQIQNSSLNTKPSTNTEESKQETIKKNILQYIKEKTGLDATSLYENGLEEGNKKIIEYINGSSDRNQIAFQAGGILYISDVDSDLKGPIFIYPPEEMGIDNNVDPVFDLSNLYNSQGTVWFDISLINKDGQRVRTKASFDIKTGLLEIEEKTENTEITAPTNPVIDEDTLNNFKALGTQLFKPILDKGFDPDLEMLLESNSVEDFANNLAQFEYMEREQCIKETILDERTVSPEEQQMIDFIVSIDNYIKSKENQQKEQPDASCLAKITIKIT